MDNRKWLLTIALMAGTCTAGALANYTATQGVGTDYGSAVISGVHYPRNLNCDATLGTTCAKVVAGSSAGTTDIAIVVADPNLLAAAQAAIPAGTNLIGSVGVDQTTVGTTNAISIKYLNTTAIATSSGNKDGGTLRINNATDQLALAAWGHVATGAAPAAGMQQVGGVGSGATGGLAQQVKVCDLHAFYTGTDNGSKTLIAGVSGRKTYICGFLLSTGTTATTLTLFKGTDADCATSGAAIGPPYPLLANDKVGVNAAFWNGFVTATNADYVCVNAGAGNQHQAEVWYTIQ